MKRKRQSNYKGTPIYKINWQGETVTTFASIKELKPSEKAMLWESQRNECEVGGHFWATNQNLETILAKIKARKDRSRQAEIEYKANPSPPIEDMSGSEPNDCSSDELSSVCDLWSRQARERTRQKLRLLGLEYCDRKEGVYP